MVRMFSAVIIALALVSFGCTKKDGHSHDGEDVHSHDGGAPHSHDDDHHEGESPAEHAAHDEHATSATPPTGEGHAPADVVPGSYEDWCGEHAVPESQCTRCNPALIPAFKSVGDWCDLHGLPKSQDLVCSPELKIERPPKPTGT